MTVVPVVDAAVFALRPDAVVLALVATGLTAGPSDDRSLADLASAARAAADAGHAADPAAHPHVAAWRDTYRAFGAKPQRTRSSVEALLRRVDPGSSPSGGLPAVNAVVDAYNAVSVRHALPAGGEDLAAYTGTPRLVRATGDEPFDTVVAGEPAVEHPEAGEVVWRDDTGVTCRWWNWRQCARTRITERTTDALFLLERLEPMSLDALAAAGDDLAGLLRGRGATVRSVLVDSVLTDGQVRQ
jgi:DNA/RNA-binding domain of Phe-tRNA-synthetase-like protein